MKNLSAKGFTLMELMIVVLVIAVLAAFAYPSYVQYVRKAKRGEAQQLMLNWSINQEIWRSNNPTYAQEDPDQTGIGILPPSHDDYVFTVYQNADNTDAVPSAGEYMIDATAISTRDQVNDKSKDGTDCSPLTLNQSGVKGPAVCWD